MADRTMSIVLLGVSGAALYSAIQLAGGAGGVRGAALPLGLSIALGSLSLALLVSTLRPARVRTGAEVPPPAPAGVRRWLGEKQQESLIFFGLFLLYVVAMEPLGFLLASTLGGTLVLRITFREPWWKATLFAALLSILGWALFREILHVPLPPGSWLRGVIG